MYDTWTKLWLDILKEKSERDRCGTQPGTPLSVFPVDMKPDFFENEVGLIGKLLSQNDAFRAGFNFGFNLGGCMEAELSEDENV